MGVINPSDTAKRQGINAATNAQINIKSGEASSFPLKHKPTHNLDSITISITPRL
ncbi:hypothetical protein JCM18902_1279 [Psychrobacter sp. JCM 18902]|nr:hypothetical protein JCM18902_1279 [Psychrobacter sp. JCM 18902]